MPDQPAQQLTQEEMAAAFLATMPTLPPLDLKKAVLANHIVQNIGGKNVLVAVLQVPYGVIPDVDVTSTPIAEPAAQVDEVAAGAPTLTVV